MSATAIPHDIVKLTAPLLLGSLFNWALYGVLIVQIYVYSYNFPKDKGVVKCLAYFVFLLETAQTALNGADVFFWFIQGFGDVDRLKDSHFAPIDIPIIHAIISFTVQAYFCYRIWILNKRSLWLCTIIAIASILQAIGGAWGGIQSEIVGKYAVSKTALYLWSLGSALADVLIAIAMILLLRRTRLKGNRFSNDILLRLVRLTIETNVITAGTAFASFVLYVAFPDEIYYVFTAGIIGKIYANTLLVSLNNRIYFREHASSVLHSSSHQVVSSQSRLEAASQHYHQVGPPARPTTIGNGFKVETMSHTIELERVKGDVVSISSEPEP
ncbi:hypothetical protein DFH94DRAFT_213402 [Russula ochroleuca]|uniref:DUF6534 domain-containing protein n=1 Tax=Russula ochroleuca TaxID=152965 RepID=A0A9P5MPV2_9AGAM|nr:hypothetical protein DFH94DRAFT_213402 [Russula ochroleuca]